MGARSHWKWLAGWQDSRVSWWPLWYANIDRSQLVVLSRETVDRLHLSLQFAKKCGLANTDESLEVGEMAQCKRPAAVALG